MPQRGLFLALRLSLRKLVGVGPAMVLQFGHDY
jgi:hypothetical protein